MTSREAADKIIESGKLTKSKWETRVFAWSELPSKEQARMAGIGDKSQVGSCVYTDFTVLICFGQVVRLKFVRKKDLGFFCDVLAETGVESRPMKEVSKMPFAAREIIYMK